MKLLNKNFIFLVGSQLFSVFGAAIVQFAISLYVLDKTGSMGTFSLVLSLSMIARVVFLPFGGIVADRFPKKKLMIIMDFLYFIMALILAFGIMNGQGIFVMAIVSIILGVVSSFETPVVQSAIPIVCTKENIPQANGIINSIAMLSNIIAPVLAGVIYNYKNAHISFIISSFFFLLAVLCEFLLVIKQDNLEKIKGSVLKIVKEDSCQTISYLKNNTIIVKICLVAFLINLVISSFISVVIPYTVRIKWSVGEELFGVMNMLFAIGGLGGSILVSIIASRIKGDSISKLFLSGSISFLLLVIPYSGIYSNNFSFWIMTGIVTISNVIFTMISVQLISFIQMMTDEKLLGRVMSFIMMISILAMPMGQMVYGYLGQFIIGQNAVILIISVAILSALTTMYSRNIFRKIKIDG